MQTKYVIYTITNLVNGKQYVGQSKDYEARWKSHRASFSNFARGKKCDNRYLAASVLKYGIANFEFTLRCSCKGLHEADYLETFFIGELNTFAPDGYNLTLGGGGTAGYVVSESTKSKYRILFSGSGNPYFGKRHSDETKSILSKARSNRVVVDDVEYASVLAASEELKLNRSHIYKLVRIGRAKLLDRPSISGYMNDPQKKTPPRR